MMGSADTEWMGGLMDGCHWRSGLEAISRMGVRMDGTGGSGLDTIGRGRIDGWMDGRMDEPAGDGLDVTSDDRMDGWMDANGGYG